LSRSPTPRRIALVVIGWVLAAAPLTLAAADRCPGGYEVLGTVQDVSGQPVSGARVHILLDQVSKKKFFEQGVRARGATTDRQGRFRRKIVCGQGDDGLADPCGSKRRFVTVAATAPGYRAQLQVLKLKELELSSDGCSIRVPPLTLTRGS
jgi:hypothetical protein